jgi:chemotaxis protein MotB
MANTATNAPIIIIKRRKKVAHAAHHGGAWKVAYADFVTAMMAFFLLLWLLNATTEEQRRGISDYFSPASVSRTTSGAGGVLGGMTVVRDGALRSDGSQLSIPLPATPTDNPDSDVDGEFAGDGGENSAAEQDRKQQTNELTPEEQDKLLAKREEERFEAAAEELRQAIQSTPELAKLAESLIIDRTPEGLRIQIVDQDKYSMFPLGSAAMYDYTRKLLAEVAKIVAKLPNRIAVTGHTDSTPYSRSSSYTNWELSTERALASRRALLDSGFLEDRIERVIGKADKEHLLPAEPNSPRNRRISIVLLRDAHAEPAGSTTGSLEQQPPTRAAAAAEPPRQPAAR